MEKFSYETYIRDVTKPSFFPFKIFRMLSVRKKRKLIQGCGCRNKIYVKPAFHFNAHRISYTRTSPCPKETGVAKKENCEIKAPLDMCASARALTLISLEKVISSFFDPNLSDKRFKLYVCR